MTWNPEWTEHNAKIMGAIHARRGKSRNDCPFLDAAMKKALGIRLTKSEANILKGVARKGSHG